MKNSIYVCIGRVVGSGLGVISREVSAKDVNEAWNRFGLMARASAGSGFDEALIDEIRVHGPYPLDLDEDECLEEVYPTVGPGVYETSDPLVSFLYELMRDHLPAGDVEQLVRSSPAEPTDLSNWWLAQYAVEVASRLRRTSEEEEA